MVSARRIVLTGGPGAGKTTVLGELARRGFRTIPEAARAVLRQEGGQALRAHDPDGFAEAILGRELDRFAIGAAEEGLAFFDRGFGDLASMPVRASDLRHRITAAVLDLRYDDPVFRAPAWRAIYHQDCERTQTWEEAVASDAAVTSAWKAAGYQVVDLPFASPQERAAFILGYL
ncbi:AAA family ATPase [Qipengyuania flava]|uniref:AAA family ATPase n=1 Tax=Qipengyuania flava TaxID=192812 RepID=UPI001C627572|nr:AAA family ATPase [Qipengyuania flava]QYJ07309.1 AAA family ATPase [Qipengyuania flava]